MKPQEYLGLRGEQVYVPFLFAAHFPVPLFRPARSLAQAPAGGLANRSLHLNPTHLAGIVSALGRAEQDGDPQRAPGPGRG